MLRILIVMAAIMLVGCGPRGIEEPGKRNEHWCWFVDKHTGEGRWVPIAGETDLPDGDYTLFFSNGGIRQVGRLKNKKDCDTVFYYNLTGKVISKVIMLPDSTKKEFMPDGKYTSYFPTCEVSGEGEVKNNKIIGTRLEYYRNGKIKIRQKVAHDTVLSLSYYESGRPADSMMYIGQKYEGLVKSWYENGRLKSAEQYKNGLNEGPAYTYYENGKPEAEMFSRHGEIDGQATFWYENGQMKSLSHYTTGKPNGKFLSWYENGAKKSEAILKDGNRDGRQVYYYSSGAIEAIQEFKNGVKVGQWKEYDEAGKLTLQRFIDGELVRD